MSKKEKEKLPEIDESQLTAGQKEELDNPKRPIGLFVFMGVILVLMIVCIIVINCLGGGK